MLKNALALFAKDYIDSDDYDSFEEYVSVAKAKQAEVEAQVSEWLESGIKEFSNEAADKFGVVSPAFTEGGIARVTWYDQDGFYSHDGVNSPEQLIKLLIEGLHNGIQPALGSLDAMSQTDQWQQGMERVREVQRMNQELRKKAFLTWMREEAGQLDDLITDWLDESEADENFADKASYYLTEETDYWRPSMSEHTDSGTEFFFPTGMIITIEKHTGKWFLETDDNLFPLASDEPLEIGQEVDEILRAGDYDLQLRETGMK
jgi:hypothetical protein